MSLVKHARLYTKANKGCFYEWKNNIFKRDEYTGEIYLFAINIVHTFLEHFFFFLSSGGEIIVWFQEGLSPGSIYPFVWKG